MPVNALTAVRPTSQYAKLIAMTTSGEEGYHPQGQPPSGGNEPPPLDQAETQFAQIPPPGYPPPAYAPPTPPPAGGLPPSGYPPQSYPPPPSYPAPPFYQPPSSGYAQPPYQSGYPGTPYAGGYYSMPSSGNNGLAIGSLVTSIVAFPLAFLCGIFGIIAAIVGVALGIVALNQIKQSGQQGRGLAIAGIVVGAVVLVLAVILIFAIGIYAFNNS